MKWEQIAWTFEERLFQGEQAQRSWDASVLGKTEECDRGQCGWAGQEVESGSEGNPGAGSCRILLAVVRTWVFLPSVTKRRWMVERKGFIWFKFEVLWLLIEKIDNKGWALERSKHKPWGSSGRGAEKSLGSEYIFKGEQLLLLYWVKKSSHRPSDFWPV